jgi:hypothetical protein
METIGFNITYQLISLFAGEEIIKTVVSSVACLNRDVRGRLYIYISFHAVVTHLACYR